VTLCVMLTAERQEKHSGKTTRRTSDWWRRICVCAREERLSQSWAVDAGGHRRTPRSRYFFV